MYPTAAQFAAAAATLNTTPALVAEMYEGVYGPPRCANCGEHECPCAAREADEDSNATLGLVQS